MGMIKNSSIVIFGVLVSNILAYIFHIYVGRALGPVEYGVFGALMSLFMIVAMPASAISSAITKFSAKLYSRKEYGKIGILRKKIAVRIWIYSALFFLILVLFSWTIADYLKIDSNFPIIIVGFTLIFAMILPVNRGILQGMKKFNALSLNTVLESLSRLFFVFIFLMIGWGISGAILAYGMGYFIAFLFVFPLIKEIKFNGIKEEIKMKNVYRFIVLVLLVNFIFQLIINAPTMLIKHFFSSEFTGYWTAALTIARITLFISSGIVLVMFSEVSGIEKDDKNAKKLIFRKAFLMTLLSSILMAIIFLIIPEVLITLLYGKEFLGAVLILEYMGIAMIFISLIQICMSYWLAER